MLSSFRLSGYFKVKQLSDFWHWMQLRNNVRT